PALTDASLRRFLLGELSEQEREQLETRLLTDEVFNARLIDAEEMLIDDYLHNALPAADQGRFIAQYRTTAVQRRRLRIAESVRDYALARGIQSSTTTQSKAKAGWFGKPKSKSPYLLPISAVLVLVLVLSGIWIIRRVQAPSIRREHFERELTALNAGDRNEISPRQMQLVTLPPVSLRSVQAGADVSISGDVRVFELHLIWGRPEHPVSYLANLKKIGGSESFNVRLVRAEGSNNGIIPFRIPASLVTPGLYQITLTGESASNPSEEYQVTFRRQ
ncbi:MAG: hypothetical protein ABR555_19400, partial [Pyrinomonadaceae bacterium]